MAAPGIIELPRIDDSNTSSGGWIVTVFDNDHNTVDEVMAVLLLATSCTAEEAYIETWEVHNLGRSVVHHAGEEECHRVAAIIATIGIKVEVSSES